MLNPPRIIASRVPLVELKEGLMTREWYRFFFDLNEIANGTTVDLLVTEVAALTTTVGDIVKNSYATAPSAITVGASPFVYTNNTAFNADVLISNGGIVTLEFSRDGSTYYSTGSYYGMFSLSPNDKLRVTYSAAPTMTLILR